MKERSRIALSIIEEIGNLWHENIETFSDLHNHCDANILGGTVAMLETVAPEDDTVEEIAAVQDIVDHYIKAINIIAKKHYETLENSHRQFTKVFINTDLILTKRSIDLILKEFF